MLRVLVTGGRDFTNRALVNAALDAVHRKRGIAVLIHGAATGADTLAAAWAEDRGVLPLPYPANWDDLSQPDARIKTNSRGKKYDANAGSRRNRQMLVEGRPDVVVAFPGGPGTRGMRGLAIEAGLTVWEPSARWRA